VPPSSRRGEYQLLKEKKRNSCDLVVKNNFFWKFYPNKKDGGGCMDLWKKFKGLDGIGQRKVQRTKTTSM
jgi:hypothetical protein